MMPDSDAAAAAIMTHWQCTVMIIMQVIIMTQAQRRARAGLRVTENQK